MEIINSILEIFKIIGISVFVGFFFMAGIDAYSTFSKSKLFKTNITNNISLDLKPEHIDLIANRIIELVKE